MIIPPLPLASLTAFVSAYSQSDLFGKLIILSLIFLSLLCWVILLHKVWLTRNVRRISSAFQAAFAKQREQLLGLDVEELPKPIQKQIPHPFGEIFHSLKQKTLEILDKNHYFAKGGKEGGAVYLSPDDLGIVESHVLTTISIQTKALEKNLFILSTIVTLAPFLGLLGTVWGILVTFSELHAGASAGSNAAVLGGLSTALATTVLGLIIAIPALVSYNYLRNAIKTFSSDMEDFLYELLSHVELQYRKADTS
jgi:biopolymer transport protein TolQ